MPIQLTYFSKNAIPFFSNGKKITSAEILRLRAFDEILQQKNYGSYFLNIT